MRAVKKVVSIYKAAAIQATISLKKAPLICVFAVLAYLVSILSGTLFGNFGMAGGLLLGFIQIALLTYFYAWISAAVRREKVTFTNFYEFDTPLFMRLISVAFIFFIVQFLVGQTTQGLNAGLIQLFVGLAMVFLFNAIPEVIVLSDDEGLAALSRALEFARDNFFAWFIPLIVMMTPLLALNPQITLLIFAKSDPLLPALLISSAMLQALQSRAISLLALPLATIATVWCTLFRMHLYRALNGQR